MIYIYTYITKYNTIIIDPTVNINADAIGAYTVRFQFQEKWDDDLTLFAVFKPKLDTPIYLQLDENNCCVVPYQIYHRYAKLGIGLMGKKLNNEGLIIKQNTTDLTYIPVRKSAGNFIEDLF